MRKLILIFLLFSSFLGHSQSYTKSSFNETKFSYVFFKEINKFRKLNKLDTLVWSKKLYFNSAYITANKIYYSGDMDIDGVDADTLKAKMIKGRSDAKKFILSSFNFSVESRSTADITEFKTYQALSKSIIKDWDSNPDQSHLLRDKYYMRGYPGLAACASRLYPDGKLLIVTDFYILVP